MLQVVLIEKLCITQARVNDALVTLALLCKCDLVSEMVYEFTSLQGVMGYYYAINDDESETCAKAILEHYQPRFSGAMEIKWHCGLFRNDCFKDLRVSNILRKQVTEVIPEKMDEALFEVDEERTLSKELNKSLVIVEELYQQTEYTKALAHLYQRCGEPKSR